MNAKFKNVEYSTFTGWIEPPTDLSPSLQGTQECDVAVVRRRARLAAG